MTYHCFHLLVNRLLRTSNTIARANQSNLSLSLSGTRGLCDVNLTPCRALHLPDCLATLSNNHSDGVRRHVYSIVDLVRSAAAAATTTTTTARSVPTRHIISGRSCGAPSIAKSFSTAITVDNFHDRVLGSLGSLTSSDKIDGSKTVDTLRLTNDVDVASRPFLQITNSLSSSANDESNCAIWHHDLHVILSISQRGGSTLVWIPWFLMSPVEGTHATIIDYSVNGCFDFSATIARARDLALAKGTTISSRQELNTALCFTFDASKVLALATNDEAYEAGLNLNGLRLIITATTP